MKFLALIFLFGLASASLLEIYPDSYEQDFLLKATKHKDNDGLETELGRQLRKELDHILKEIKQTVEEGKDVSQDLLDQAKDLVRKLKDYGEDVSEEAKDLLNYLKTVQRWVNELLDILHKDSSKVHRAGANVKTDFGKKLKELFDHIVDRVKQSVDEGKHISDDLLNKAKEVAKKLNDYGINVSNDAKKLLEELKQKYSKWAQDLLDLIHGKNTTVHKAQEDTELGRKLQDALERVLRRIKKLVEEGKHVSEKLTNEAKDLARRLKKYGLQVSDEAKDMLNYLKERYNRWVQELLDLIRGENSTLHRAEQHEESEFAKELREAFKRLVKRIKETVKDGRHVSQKLLDEARDLAQKLRDYGVNVRDEIVDMIKYVKDRYHQWVQDLIDIIQGKKDQKTL